MSGRRVGRSSDRLVTPAVVCVFLVVAGGLVGYIATLVSDLARAGVDPAPVLDLVAKVTTAIGALGTLVLQLVGRAQVSRVERNTGQLAASAQSAADSAPQQAG